MRVYNRLSTSRCVTWSAGIIYGFKTKTRRPCFVDSLRPTTYSVKILVGNMDYLSRLPVEIWREILIFDAPFVNLDDVDFSRHTEISRTLNKLLRQTQSRRYQLLTTCKSLHSLVESLLYFLIVLKNNMEMRRFMSVLVAKHRRGEDPSRYMQALIIYYVSPSELSELPEDNNLHGIDITSIPVWPNLKRLFLVGPIPIKRDYFIGRNMRPKPMPDPKYLNADVLMELSTRAPNVKQLSVISYNQLGIQDQVPAFSSIHSLLFDMSFTRKAMPRVECPSLVALSLMVTCSEDVLSGIQQYASTIRELELTASPFTILFFLAFNLPNEIFSQCRKLRKLTFDISHMDPPLIAIDALYTKLHSLVLFVKLPMPTEVVERKLTFFSKERFINLSSVTINALLGQTDADLDSFCAIVSRIFAPMDCDIYILNN